MKYVYHVYCKFLKADKFPVRIANWDFLYIANTKIDNDDQYKEMKKTMWENVGDNIQSHYTISDMNIISLSFLHEVEE